MKVPFLIIGGGLSGIAAAIRFSRFEPGAVILEKHSRIGGLNSYYYRNKRLIETGLHAITNFAPANQKNAPLNRLLRQLKLKRRQLQTHEQLGSEIRFVNRESLCFSNDFDLFHQDIGQKFPHSLDRFNRLLKTIESYDPFQVAPFKSAKTIMGDILENDLLTDMILCPLMFYGSSVEDDMDFGQFVIMFRAIFLEGFFRPSGTIKEFLDLLQNHLESFGGQVRLNSTVKRIIHNDHRVSGVELTSGEVIHCDHMVSTIGLEETFDLLEEKKVKEEKDRLGFIESIFLVDKPKNQQLTADRTIIFYHLENTFHYRSPTNRLADLNSGVICFPGNFQGVDPGQPLEIRATHLADYDHWKAISGIRSNYLSQKRHIADQSKEYIEKIIGKFRTNIIFEDTFTPITVERFTAKKKGAIYGSPHKIMNGDIGFQNLFIAGTDQGFLGIIGSMLSGVSIVNQHILPAL